MAIEDSAPFPEPDPSQIRDVGFTQFYTQGSDPTASKTYKRRRGTTEWHLVSPTPPSITPSHPSSSSVRVGILYLVRHLRYPGEPFHWSLVLTLSDESREAACVKYGRNTNYAERYINVYEVRGDANFMEFKKQFVRTHVTLLPEFHDAFELARWTLDEDDGRDKAVEKTAENEKPPRADSRSDVRENCQGWCVRVVQKLVEKGLVDGGKVEMMRRMMEPV